MAKTLLLKVWEHFAAQHFCDMASEMYWSVSDCTPMLGHWFYKRDAAYITRRMQAVAPLTLCKPDVLTTVID